MRRVNFHLLFDEDLGCTWWKTDYSFECACECACACACVREKGDKKGDS